MPRRLALALLATLIALPSQAEERIALPEIGSSAAQLISPAEEAQYGRELLGELRHYGYLLDDALLEEWLGDVGHRLAARSERPEQPFTFFIMRDRQINAFATLGGYVGMNVGLVLTAEREDEVAAVLAHEISHSTQRHVVRSVEAAQKDSIPIMIAMLGAIALSQQSNSNSSSDAAQAAIAGGLGLIQQRQINFTRANEHEADRIGIQILGRTGYDPMAMADFFGRMMRATRSQGDATPDYLRTHPVTTTRISEAKDRAQSLAGDSHVATGLSAGPINPTLAVGFHDALDLHSGPDPLAFELARERMRVLSSESPAQAQAEYLRREHAGRTLNAGERYGLALARMQTGDAGAIAAFAELAQAYPQTYWFELGRAEALHRGGRKTEADTLYAHLLDLQPRNRAIALSYAATLAERGSRDAGLTAQSVLRPLLAARLDDPGLQHAYARASELAGDTARAAEAYAETAFLSGRAEDALNQLQALKERTDIDYVQRARIDARIAEMTPIVLELRKRGIRAGDVARERGSLDAAAPINALR